MTDKKQPDAPAPGPYSDTAAKKPAAQPDNRNAGKDANRPITGGTDNRSADQRDSRTTPEMTAAEKDRQEYLDRHPPAGQHPQPLPNMNPVPPPPPPSEEGVQKERLRREEAAKPAAMPAGAFHSSVTIPGDWATLSVVDTVALAKKINPDGDGNPSEIIKAEVARRDADKVKSPA